MANEDIRNYAKCKGVNLYEVSEKLGYAHESAFSRILRHELPAEKKKIIQTIIDQISEVPKAEKFSTIFDYLGAMNSSQKQHLLACAEQILLRESEE